MANIQPRERATIGSILARPFADVWGFDPFRSLNLSGIEISRTDAGYTVEMPVAGFQPNEIDVSLEDGLLTVSGKSDKRSFTRSFTVPDNTDEDHIDAKVEHGMLTLTLPLVPKAQPKKIEIKSS